MIVVRFIAPDGAELRVTPGERELVLGRPGSEVDVALEGDRALSRRHGRIWSERGRIFYEDLGSANGSWLEKERLERAVELAPGLRLRLGNTVLAVEAPSAPPPATVRMTIPATGRMPVGGRYLGALMDVARGLLRSSSQELVSSTTSRLAAVVPGVRQVSLLRCPLEMNAPGEFDLSLGRYALDNDQALLADTAIYVPLFGSLGVLWANGGPFTDAELELFRAVGELLAAALSTDVLREEARQSELEAIEQRARQAAMVNFLKIASHDLKNPLAVVQGCAQLLDCHADRPERVSALAGDLMDAARRSLFLIDGYLQVAEVESGREIHVDWQPIAIEALIRAELAFLQRALPSESCRFDVRVDCPEVWADEARLRQILSNLIGNAIKYSPEGGEISIEVLGGDDRVTFRVSDQGRGIDPEEQQRLFRQFERLSSSRHIPGTGLGLWLTQALVEAHGGRLSVASRAGEGSTFSFAIPV